MDPIDKQAAFLSVIASGKGIMYKIAHAYCNNSEDWQDLIQEIIIQLWRTFDQYDNQYRHSTWIYRIALNVAISFYRKDTTRKKVTHSLPGGFLNYVEQDDVDLEEDINFLHQFIAELKQLDKAIMLLYLEKKAHKEIADIMGISVTNVATRISRIKEALKNKFIKIKNQ